MSDSKNENQPETETPENQSPTPTLTQMEETTEDSSNGAQTATFSSEDGDETDLFGYSVSVSADGTTVLIGARNDEDPNGSSGGSLSGAGSAYIFDGSGGSWDQQAKLVPEDGEGGDNFGNAVAVSSDGTTAIIGASGDKYSDNKVGSAYLFTSSGGSWSQQAKLTPDDGDSGDLFGNSVSLSGDGATAVVGAVNDRVRV